MNIKVVKQVETLIKQASQLYEAGKLTDASVICITGLEYLEKHLSSRHKHAIPFLNILGSINFSLGKYGEAERFLRQAIDLVREHKGEDHVFFASAMNNLGLLFRETGRYSEAESVFLRVIEIFKSSDGASGIEFSKCLSNLANLYSLTGQVEKADPLYRTGQEIVTDILGKNHPLYAEMLVNRSVLASKLGRNDEAFDLLDSAIEILDCEPETCGAETALLMRNIAALYKEMRELDKAEISTLRSIELSGKSTIPDTKGLALSLLLLGSIYLELKKFKLAYDTLISASEIIRRGYGGGHPLFASSLVSIAAVFKLERRYREASRLIEQSIDILKNHYGDFHPDIAVFLIELSIVNANDGNFHNALEYIKEAENIHNSVIDRLFPGMSDSQQLSFIDKIRREVSVCLSVYLQFEELNDAQLHKLYEYILRRKSIVSEFASGLPSVKGSTNGLDASPESLEARLLKRRIATRSIKGPGVEGPAVHNELLKKWRDQLEILEGDQGKESTKETLQTNFNRVDLDSIRNGLPQNTVLVEYLQFHRMCFGNDDGDLKPEHIMYLAFVLTGSGKSGIRLVELGSANEIDDLISKYKESIVQSTSLHNDQVDSAAAGNILREKLFDPLLLDSDSTEYVVIATDGAVSLLPFETLPVSDGHFLLDEISINYLLTGRDVLRKPVTKSARVRPPVVIADPVFKLDADTDDNQQSSQSGLTEFQNTGYEPELLKSLKTHGFPRLRFSDIEGKIVAGILNVTPVLGVNACKQTILDLVSPEILHISTHGYYLPNDKIAPGDQSGFVLSGIINYLQGQPVCELGNGVFSADDVAGLDISGTRLVVLSACETGVGSIHEIEGVMGLRRAFRIAGAETLVLSLWPVPDLASAILMKEFYENYIHKSMPIKDALRLAQSTIKNLTSRQLFNDWLNGNRLSDLSVSEPDVIRSIELLKKMPDSSKPFESPLYWGAFICIGSVKPV